jgi:IS605 OrfB family transposase
MKLIRSSKCTLRYATAAKRQALRGVLLTYGRIVNEFIDQFWAQPVDKTELLKDVVNSVKGSTARLRKVAAREALDMCLAAKNQAKESGKKAVKPRHRGKRMCLSSTIADLLPSKSAKSFDCWLHLQSLGFKLILDFPIRLHRHFHALAREGKRLASYVITENYVQFAFEIKTEPKLEPDRCVGIDTGINALASVSTGHQFGLDIKSGIDRVKRCKHGSHGQRTASRALRQRMAECCKEILNTLKPTLIVVEDLKGITKNTKRRIVSKGFRRSIGRWNVRFWLGALERLCERNRVSFRRVSARYTSQTCHRCGHIDRRNRSGEPFKCLKCNHQANADVQASLNILIRFLTGLYGAGCKALIPTLPDDQVLLGFV